MYYCVSYLTLVCPPLCTQTMWGKSQLFGVAADTDSLSSRRVGPTTSELLIIRNFQTYSKPSHRDQQERDSTQTETVTEDMTEEEGKKRTVEDATTTVNVVQKKQHQNRKLKNKKYKSKPIDPTAPLGVLQYEIANLLKEHDLTSAQTENDLKLILNDESVAQIYHRTVTNVPILQLSSNGDGLALIGHPTNIEGKQVVVVPFGLPGDVVTIKVFKSHPTYVESDLISIEKPSNIRDDSRISCRYFGSCSGCQYQAVAYLEQLELKRQTIINAYNYFASQLKQQDKLPEIDKTQGSPLELGYRTKLTPHFNVPNKNKEIEADFVPALGFGAKGRPTWRKTDGGSYSILDIEECNIGTQIINIGMKNERSRFKEEWKKYKNGATILLREDTHVLSDDNDNDKPEIIGSKNADGNVSLVEIEVDNGDKLLKTCVTESRQIVKEYVNGYTFEFSAGEFFQNNNSILPLVTNYVKENLSLDGLNSDLETYLVDAYCGSGLFSITCSKNVSRVIGVEVSADSVKFAERNAASNKIPNCKFIVGKAEKIFEDIDIPASQTAVILDPPRKGCDEVFLNQLAAFNPVKIVYISCNVHSQARDVEWFINNTTNGSQYQVESIKGFDFFPQTHHIESVAVLKRAV